MLHAQQMTSARQNALESTIDRRGLDLHCEVVWSKKGKVNLMAGAASRKREPSQLGGLTLQAVPVDSKRLIFDSSVCRGIPSLAAAPEDPQIRRLLLYLQHLSTTQNVPLINSLLSMGLGYLNSWYA